MGMNINSATTIIRDFLQDQLVDPLNARTSDWIYDDGMRVDLDKTGYPKILIKKIEQPSLKEQTGIGETSTINTDEIVIQIKTMAGAHYTRDSVDYKAIDFAAEIARQSENLIKTNHDFFVTQGFQHVIMKKDNITIDRDKNPTFEQTIEMKYLSLDTN